MPIYNVRLRVNVPSLGERNVDQTNIMAVDIVDAIKQAKDAVIVEPIQVQKIG
jgi:hypothetical protein